MNKGSIEVMIFLLFFAGGLGGADICISVDNDQVDRVVNAMEGLYTIPVDTNGVPEFTANQWAKECVRRWVKKQVHRWEAKSAADSIKAYQDSVAEAQGGGWIQ